METLLVGVDGKPGVYTGKVLGENAVIAYRRIEWEEPFQDSWAKFGTEQIRATKKLAAKLGLEFFVAAEIWVGEEFQGSFLISGDDWERAKNGTKISVGPFALRQMSRWTAVQHFRAEIVDALIAEEVAMA
jgi:hypothetical protein